MENVLSFSTRFSNSLAIRKFPNAHLISQNRYNPFPHLPTLRAISSVSPLVYPRLACVSNSAVPLDTSSVCKDQESAIEGVPEAIVLSIRGMSGSECAQRVKRILERQDKVYVVSVNLTKETAIVWPKSDSKAEPNWDKLLGDELASHLTTHGFESNLQDTFHGCFRNTPYSDWPGHTFVSLAPHDSELESHAKEVDALKVKVKDLLLDSTRDLTLNIQLISSLCRLGVSYHFEHVIEEQLDHIFATLPKYLEDSDHDLNTVATFFRVLRQHGYGVNCDVFEKFQTRDGKFKKDVPKDIKGILSLYEACFLTIPGEDTLDEALIFTRKCLKDLDENSSPALQKHIRHSLMFPCHRTAERLDALHYIAYYEADESANKTLLRFAKLDFNGQQLICKKELALLSKWWIDTNLMEKFPHTRDRLVESYLWALGCIYEPQYSSARLLIAKYTQLITFVDDIYDTYGTFEDLCLLTDALRRFTMDAVSDELPEYMKHICRILIDDLENYNGMKGCSFEGLANNGTNGCSYKTSYLKEMIKEIVRCEFVEAKWKKGEKAALFDDYMENGSTTCAFEILAASFILGIENMGMKEILWVRNRPRMVEAAQFVGRLLNDITGRTDGKQRQDFPKGVDCYMEQYKVLENEAVEAIHKIVEHKWKVMNEEMVNEKQVPKILRKYALNYCRMTIALNGGVTDFFTYPSNLNELITSLFIKPFPL